MAAYTEQPLWNWTLRRIRRIWPLGDGGDLKHLVAPDLPGEDIAIVKEKIDLCLQGRGGEVSARARAAELGETYLILNATGRRRFLQLLAAEYGTDRQSIDAGIVQWQKSSDDNELYAAKKTLRAALEPRRARLFRQFTELHEGVKFLVDLRSEVLTLIKEYPELKPLDQDLYALLVSWFDIGFLDLQQITWHTPAALLEKLIAYEAVHAIRSWDDLKNRLAEDRRCFAFFHPRMPNEPLIFVEVALVNGIATNVQTLLDEQAPILSAKKADTAIFYSISNCQNGLAGVSFGNFLIKRVVKALTAELPNLKNFSTLSPIPGFIPWLTATWNEKKFLEKENRVRDFFLEHQKNITRVRAALGGQSQEDGELAAYLQNILMKLCARYLAVAKKGSQAFDRVAHFHLSNGARIEQINWMADLSDKGLIQSGGLMVNYLYKLNDIEKNHEAYSDKGKVNYSSTVGKLL